MDQTLLDAAKALVGTLAWSNHWAKADLRAAIAREEAKPMQPPDWCIKMVHDRAQTAEASARWHRDESERLSIAIAALREEHAKFREQVDSGYHLRQIREELQASPLIATIDAAKALRQRAEKAEGELAKASAGLERQKSLLIFREERCQKAEAEAARWKARADEAEAAVESHCGALPPFEGDPKACAFKPAEPKVGIVRDPVTGWTFDTMRQQFDAARTTVRVLAAELVAARQQIAGTKGFEAKRAAPETSQ